MNVLEKRTVSPFENGSWTSLSYHAHQERLASITLAGRAGTSEVMKGLTG